MTEATVVLTAFEKITAWFNQRRNIKEQNTELERKAIRELLQALGKTKIYITSLKRGKADTKEEEVLVQLWFNAASSFYGINAELARQLEFKGEYWTNPSAWSDSDVIKAGISIEEISEKAREILGK